MRLSTIAVLAAGTTLLATTANAATTLYADSASFLAAASVSATKDFNADAAGTNYMNAEILPGVVATTNDAYLQVFNSGAIGNILFGYGDYLTSKRYSGTFYYEFDLTPGHNAVAFDVEAWNPASTASIAKVVLGDGTVTSFSISQTGALETDPVFVGFTANTDIRKIFWYEGLESGSLGNEEVGINMFQVGNTPAVPEPETYAMMMVGLGLLGCRKRRGRAA